MNLSIEEERQAIAQARAEPEALQRLYRAYHPRIFAYVAHSVGRKADAEDVVSETFIRMVKALDRFNYRGEGSFAAWLFQIARHEVLRFFGTHKGGTADIPLEDLPEIASDLLLPEQAYQRQETYAYLRQLIEQLSPRRREIIQLRFFGGLRNKEIAVVLGIDERSVAGHLTRALADLRRDYAALPVKGYLADE